MDTFFPNHTCLVCNGEINKFVRPLLCDKCAKILPRHERICDKCGGEISLHAVVCDRCISHVKQDKDWYFDRARSTFEYKSPVVELVLRLKYNAEGDIARFVASLLADAIKEYDIKADIIIPVPLAPKRFKERGYNQAGLIAEELSKIIKVPVTDNFVYRVKHTAAQKQMTLKERQDNLLGAFEIRPPYSAVKGKRILLVDDVLTTCATVNECARVIRRAKPESIEVLTIASVSQKLLVKQPSGSV